MSQSRKHSAAEVVANVLVGYWVAVAANAAILPLFGLHPSMADNMAIGGLFTVVSLARGYLLRRLFNRWAGR